MKGTLDSSARVLSSTLGIAAFFEKAPSKRDRASNFQQV